MSLASHLFARCKHRPSSRSPHRQRAPVRRLLRHSSIKNSVEPWALSSLLVCVGYVAWMANEDQLRIMGVSVEAWNTWRLENPGVTPDLGGADLFGASLGGADLRDGDLAGADLRDGDLGSADLRGADLAGADLRDGDLGGADLRGANLAARI